MEKDRIKSGARIEVNIRLDLTELEARALNAITVYGAKPFKEWFYKHLGTSYLKPHNEGIDSLFDTINRELPSHLKKADDAREVFTGKKIATRPKEK